MSDRLNELRRQRALLQEHLDWLDREIAATSGAAHPAARTVKSSTPPMVAAPAALSPIISVSLSESPAAHDTEALLRQYASDPKDSEASVKRGCWVAFLASFAFLGLLVAIWYIGVYARK